MRAGPEHVVLKKGHGFHLICVPFAGGSARSFVRLSQHAPEDWHVTAVQPPAGQGPTDTEALAGFYLDLLSDALTGPGLLLGHSLGAVVAYQMARLRPPSPDGDLHLVMSAPPDPGLSARSLLDLDDRALLAEAARRGILPELQVSEDFALRFVLPHLRADLDLLREGWEPGPVSVPVHLLGGSLDTASLPATVRRLEEALKPRSTRTVAGGHLYVVDQPARTADALIGIGRLITDGAAAADARDAAR